MKHGGKVEDTTSAGLNMIHVSAQGNSPASTLFFMSKGLSINSRDANGYTPLHHAAYAGSDLYITYAAGFGADIDA